MNIDILKLLFLYLIKDKPCNIDFFIHLLYSKNVGEARKLAKNVVWSLVDEGLAIFNDSWELCITSEGEKELT